ncbi:MAG TPA: hypothetical protein VG168_02955 [Bryobacteraceae bacterium]|nr:hypothetical protein [Bryobacteraceae bacterium]
MTAIPQMSKLKTLRRRALTAALCVGDMRSFHFFLDAIALA